MAIMKEFWLTVENGKKQEAADFLSSNPWLLTQKTPRANNPKELRPFIHKALYSKAPDIVAQGFALGVPLEDRCYQGKTALHALLQWLKSIGEDRAMEFTPLVEQVILSGARCDCMDNRGEPMWVPAMGLPMSTFEKFIEHAPTMDFLHEEGWSGLSIALCRAPLDKVKLIVQKGANVNLFEQRAMPFAPILSAFLSDFSDTQTHPAELADYLLSRGALLHTKDALQRTFLHHAPNAKAVSWLLDHGFDLEAQDAFGRTPLLHVLQHNNKFLGGKEQVEVATALILAGADLQACDDESTSLPARNIIAAEEKQWPELVNMLRSFEVRKRADQIMTTMA